MRAFIKENTWLERGISDHGWGNGYVVLPWWHPLHGAHYDNIPVPAPGGLTFSRAANELDWPELEYSDRGGWVVGFDTSHCCDTLARWPEAAVREAAEELKNELQSLKWRRLNARKILLWLCGLPARYIASRQ